MHQTQILTFQTQSTTQSSRPLVYQIKQDNVEKQQQQQKNYKNTDMPYKDDIALMDNMTNEIILMCQSMLYADIMCWEHGACMKTVACHLSHGLQRDRGCHCLGMFFLGTGSLMLIITSVHHHLFTQTHLIDTKLFGAECTISDSKLLFSETSI